MTPLVKICKENNCSLIITDVTQDSDQYVDESVANPKAWHERNKFKYSETYTLNIIYKHTTNSDDIITSIITDHCSYLDEEHVKLKEDGYYTIDHIILPSIDTYDASIELDWYVCDGGSIYTRCENKWEEVTFNDLAKLVENNKLEGTTISGVSLTQFSICHLYECYVRKCQAVFKTLQPCPVKDVDFARDLVWMAINVIKYYVEIGQLLEAQSLLEELHYCGELCSEDMSSTTDCGCSRKA